MKILNKSLVIFLILFILIQFIPVNRDNPEFDVEYDFNAPQEVREIVVNSCYDCHSNQTNWPWYSYVAPTSWFVTDHVNEGRENINFSKWLRYTEEEQMKIKDEMLEEIEESNMPLPPYVLLHSESEITEDKLLILKTWAFAQADSI